MQEPLDIPELVRQSSRLPNIARNSSQRRGIGLAEDLHDLPRMVAGSEEKAAVRGIDVITSAGGGADSAALAAQSAWRLNR